MSKRIVASGNKAAALGVQLVSPDVIAAYPITPQTPLVEYLSQFAADGQLSSTIIEVESEHSAMSTLQGAACSGARTFTATSSQGLALMFEPYFRNSTLRLPTVMAIIGREMTSPETIWSSQQDSMTVRDAGWIQLHVENNQEIIDTIIQAFRIAEDHDVLIPVNVCYDGFLLSHMSEAIVVPEAEKVKQFVPPYVQKHLIFDPKDPMCIDPMTPGPLMLEFRKHHLDSMQRALSVIEKADSEYSSLFGRSWGGVLEAYRCEDASHLLFTVGSMTGAAREAVDYHRENGVAVGLVKLRSVRPFPKQRIAQLLQGKTGFAVVDRNVSFGWDCGIIYQEVKAVASDCGQLVSVPVIGGLGGADITVQHFIRVIDEMLSRDKSDNWRTLWLTGIEEVQK